MNTTLAILTFNVGLLHLGFLGMTIVEPAPYINERLQSLPKALIELDADIIALQEIYDTNHKQFLISELKPIYPYASYYDKKRHFGLRSSLMIFSKYTINEHHLELFKNTPFDEKYFDSKGVLYTSINTPLFGTIKIYNVHTTAGGLFYHPEDTKSNNIRQQQIHQVLSEVDNTEENLSIILGDFNTGPKVSRNNYQSFINAGYIDVFLNYCKQKNPNYEQATWDNKNPLNAAGPHRSSPPQRVDHMFIPQKFYELIEIVEAKVVFKEPIVNINSRASVTLSDHYGIFIRIKNHGMGNGK